MGDAGDRVVWIDTARALSVIGVVLLHVTIWGLYPSHQSSASTDFWTAVNAAIGPLRIPALMALSGLLLSSRILRGWRDRRTVVSVCTSIYLYVLWLAIYTVIGAAGLHVGSATLPSFESQLVLPRTVLWFILGLAVWTSVLASVRRLPPIAVLGALAAVSFAAPLLPGDDGSDLYLRVLKTGVYFAVGVYGAGVIKTMSPDHLIRAGFACIIVYAFLAIFDDGMPNPLVQSVLATVAGLLGPAIVFALAMIVSGLPAVGAGLGAVGRRTIAVYVLHMPLILLLGVLGVWRWLFSVPLMGWIGPVVATTALVGSTVLVSTAADRLGPRFLFALPRRFLARMFRRLRRPRSHPALRAG